LHGAEQGDPDSQNLLAYLYHNGKGVVNDDVKAAKWARRRSAEQGKDGAQALLGGLYFEGRGVLRDYVEADKWWILAAWAKDASAGLIADQKALDEQLSRNDASEAHAGPMLGNRHPNPKQSIAHPTHSTYSSATLRDWISYPLLWDVTLVESSHGQKGIESAYQFVADPRGPALLVRAVESR
jgi:TPR repeat protein